MYTERIPEVVDWCTLHNIVREQFVPSACRVCLVKVIDDDKRLVGMAHYDISLY